MTMPAATAIGRAWLAAFLLISSAGCQHPVFTAHPPKTVVVALRPAGDRRNYIRWTLTNDSGKYLVYLKQPMPDGELLTTENFEVKTAGGFPMEYHGWMGDSWTRGPESFTVVPPEQSVSFKINLATGYRIPSRTAFRVRFKGRFEYGFYSSEKTAHQAIMKMVYIPKERENLGMDGWQPYNYTPFVSPITSEWLLIK